MQVKKGETWKTPVKIKGYTKRENEYARRDSAKP